eukprot:NODE_18876_length_871_cov_1.571237.p5 GENE.NODE_18876_length_871_cov_1.571237~~NODE_18876_length_871_cov_1.571237.p5  ORF type:complete len:63 (-),score=14.44 NODE_18876_length_871_cov_1.571237:233-421(-)
MQTLAAAQARPRLEERRPLKVTPRGVEETVGVQAFGLKEALAKALTLALALGVAGKKGGRAS